ncbi:hypothetical protein KA047_03130 [Candidatus Saccharibacteria bacterium]|nr:hypothetical protein [Candidatus Saccharibacteria bacterium]
MFKLDDNLLQELGLGTLPPAEKNRMLAHIYETLEMRVGMRLAEQMTNEQLDEFERFIDANDEAGALKWLETNFPNYKNVVAEELEKLKAEIKTAAPQIVAASQQAQAAMPPAGAVPPAPGAGMPPNAPAAPQNPGVAPADNWQPPQPPQVPPAAPQQ